MKKISIIIPCYNVEKYIAQCLDSVVNQTYKNLEIICVNDGSTDNTLSIIQAFQKKDNRIIVTNQKNSGLSSARNSGLKKVSGDYIIFVDSDDFIDLNTCEIAINEISKENYDLVIWNYTKEFTNSSVKKLIFGDKKIIFNDHYCKNILRRRIFGLTCEELKHPEDADSLVTAWGKMYKTSTIRNDNIEFIDTKIIGTEDALFNVMVLKNVKKAIYIPNCLNHYRKDNEESLTTIYKKDLITKWSTLYSCMNDIIHDEKLGPNFHKALNNRIALSIIGLGLNELSNPNGTLAQIKNIKKIISSAKYKDAYKQLELTYFPIHWKIFFFFAKNNLSIGLFVLLRVMNLLRGTIG